MAWYSLFVLKVPLNTSQPTNQLPSVYGMRSLLLTAAGTILLWLVIWSLCTCRYSIGTCCKSFLLIHRLSWPCVSTTEHNSCQKVYSLLWGYVSLDIDIDVLLYRPVPVHRAAVRHTSRDLLQCGSYTTRSALHGCPQRFAVPQNYDAKSLVTYCCS